MYGSRGKDEERIEDLGADIGGFIVEIVRL